jgi:LysR family glycine cleavage system transcriptional activator
MNNLRDLPPLQAFLALIRVAQANSFTLAAEGLFLTQSAVSRQIQQLESYFGVQLFERNSRNVRLTGEGEQVRQFAQAVLTQLRDLEDRLSPQKRPFRVRMHVTLAVRWLLPRLNDFYRQYPTSSIAIETVASEVVEPTTDCDAFIAYQRSASNDANSLNLFDEMLVPVCSPRLQVRGKLPECIDDLRETVLLHGSGDSAEWQHWMAVNGTCSIANFRHLNFNLDELALDAATRGLGVAMTDWVLARDSIERGTLCVPFGKPLKTNGVYCMHMQPSSRNHPEFEIVAQWFAAQSGRSW